MIIILYRVDEASKKLSKDLVSTMKMGNIQVESEISARRVGLVEVAWALTVLDGPRYDICPIVSI